MEEKDLAKKTEIESGADIFYHTESKTFLMANYSRKGSGHIRNNSSCQDFSLVCRPDGTKNLIGLICLADGHGGSKHDLSEFGASLACETVRGLFTKRKERLKKKEHYEAVFCSADFKESLVSAWRKKVDGHNILCYGESADYSRYGTTLHFAAVFKRYTVLGRIGDGAAAVLTSEGGKYFGSAEKTGTKTESLGSRDAVQHIETEILETDGLFFVLLASDGIADRFQEGEDFTSLAGALDEECLAGGARIRGTLSGLLDEIAGFTDDDMSAAFIKLFTKADKRGRKA